MRDQLIGHVLGALEAHEHEEVEKLLKTDHQLCQELELIRKSLDPLECDKDHLEPPMGLAASTCKRVAALRVEKVHPADRRVAAGGGRSRSMLFGWSLVDLAVAASIFVAAGLLLFPAIHHSRFNAQVANCQYNLRTIGSALNDYSRSNPQGAYPAIPVSQKYATGGMTTRMAAAGMYAPQLIERGYIPAADKDKVFRCSSSENCSRGADSSVPTMADLQKASDNELPALLRRAGGSYGYTLGYHDYNDAQGEYHPTVARGRANFPIMADAPCPKLGFNQSSNHGGYGQNVLYDDGHVRYMTTCHHSEKDADPDFYHNHKGNVAAGENADDAVIGWSGAKPQ